MAGDLIGCCVAHLVSLNLFLVPLTHIHNSSAIMQPRSHAGTPEHDDKKHIHYRSSSWTPTSKHSLQATTAWPGPPSVTSPISDLPRSPRLAQHTRERSWHYGIAPTTTAGGGSAPLYGRPFPRSRHQRQHSSYSSYSSMSDTDLPWTTADIGFNAISGKFITCI